MGQQHGFLWSVRRDVTKPEPDTIVLQPLTGGVQHSMSFWIPGSSETWLEDVAVTQDHKIVVVGSFSRAGDSAQNNYVSELDLQGHVLSTSTLGEYEPERVCSANDGTLWMVGQVWAAEIQGRSYTILRNYSAGGVLLRSYLDRNELPAVDLNLSARLSQQGGTHARVLLACGAQSVGAYVGSAFTWVEVRLSDYSEHVWWVKAPAKGVMRITGLALLGEHVVYASFEPADPERFLPQ
jgi:hypothetical protein